MYKIKELAKIANISTRTLRYYDKIGILHPFKIDQNGYRLYGTDEVDQLQQILFYKELGYTLDTINLIIKSNSFNQIDSLYDQLTSLTKKKERIESIIDLVIKTIDSLERGETMNDKDKFEVWKEKEINKNMEKYGDELNSKYGEETISNANKKFKNKSKYQIEHHEKLTKKLNQAIIDAMETNNPSSELANKMCDLHKEWISFYWTTYNREQHLSLVEMYTLDERFTKYYDKIRVGAAQFLYSAMKHYMNK